MRREVRMAIIRPVGYPVSLDFYNSQEIGLARGLSLCGVNVDVYVAGSGAEVDCRTVATKGDGIVRLFQVPFFRLPLIDHALYPKLRHLLSAGNYDLIQVNEENELTCFFVARFASNQRIPVVVYQGMYQQITGRVKSAFQKCYDTLLLPFFRRYVTMGIGKTTRARQHLEGKGFHNTVTIPVGLDPTPFQKSSKRDWRNELGIESDSRILLYVGIFEKRRNVDFMIDLAKEVAESGIVLVMAGSGPEHERITARIGNESIGNVKLAGKVPQEYLPSLYLEADLFLLPSSYEIYGMVVLESMYFGLPAISTRTAGPEDIIENGVDGLLVDNLDPGQWAKTVTIFLSDPVKQAGMRKAAERKVKGALLWEHIAVRYLGTVLKPALSGSGMISALTGVPTSEENRS